MYTAPLEADYRSSTPAVSRGTSHSSDLFAELLRRHADVNEPAPQPEEEAARPASRSQRDRAPVEETDTTRAADADGAKSVAADADAAQHPIQEPAPTEGSDTAAALGFAPPASLAVASSITDR